MPCSEREASSSAATPPASYFFRSSGVVRMAFAVEICTSPHPQPNWHLLVKPIGTQGDRHRTGGGGTISISMVLHQHGVHAKEELQTFWNMAAASSSPEFLSG